MLNQTIQNKYENVLGKPLYSKQQTDILEENLCTRPTGV